VAAADDESAKFDRHAMRRVEIRAGGERL